MSIARNSKEQRFISIYQTYADEVYQYVFLRTGFDVGLAEDITQDIFLDAYKGFNGFRGLCSDRTWIFKIAKNKVFDFYRQQYNQQSKIVAMNDQSVEQLSDPKQDLEECLQLSFERQYVRECLSQLPQQYKIVLLLKYIEEKRVKEIAQILDRSPKSVESMLQRAKAAFIKHYTEREDKPGGNQH